MEDSEFIWFRELFDEIVEYDGDKLFYDLLMPWIEKAKPAIAALSQFRHLSTYDF